MVGTGGAAQAARNRRNVLLAAAVATPSLLFLYAFLNLRPAEEEPGWWGWVCDWGSSHPIALLNVLFFVNVNVLFWIISLVQQSTWLIDLYWTVLPVMMGHYYASHPSASFDKWRSRVVLGLLWLWSLRLTHSYFRRENWNWGEREDWRFAALRAKHQGNWWWMSFFVVYVSQQVFLVGICLPLYTIHNSTLPWNTYDTLTTLVCLSSLVIAYFADTQLHTYMTRKQILKQLGAPAPPVLQQGLWFYSRHPNYFGEQLWWWGLSLFSWNLGQGWESVGAAVNSACLAYVTVLVERKMLESESRAPHYREYQRSTSVCIPWFKSRGGPGNSPKDGKKTS